MSQEKGDCAEKAEDKPDGLDKIKNNTREQEMSSSQPPYSLGGVKYAASIFFPFPPYDSSNRLIQNPLWKYRPDHLWN